MNHIFKTWTFIYWFLSMLNKRIVFLTYILEWSLLSSWWLERISDSWILAWFVLKFNLFSILDLFVLEFIFMRWPFASVLRYFRFIFFSASNSWWLFWILLYCGGMLWFSFDSWMFTFYLLIFSWRMKRRFFAF